MQMRSFTIYIALTFLFTGCEIWTVEDKPGSWEYVTEFPGSARESAKSFVIDDVAYIGLGFNQTGDNNYINSDSIYLHDFWKYDPSANTWTQLADFPGKTTRDVTGFTVNDVGYIIVQYGLSNTMWEYNSKEDNWEQLDDFPGFSRNWAISFTINNRVFYGLGRPYDPILKDRIGTTDLWEYMPIPGTWIRKADFPGFAREYASSFTIDNKAYICGGRLDTSSSLTTTSDIWEYNSENDTWTQKANFGGYSRHR